MAKQATNSRSFQIDHEVLRRALASEEELVFAYLFGTQASGETTPLSDVDVAVYPARPLDLDRRLGIIQRMSVKTTCDDLDVTFLNRVDNLYILKAIVDDGIVMLDRDPDRRAMFEVMVQHRFIDFVHQRKIFLGR